MFKFIKAKGPHPTQERQKLQKELYCYRRTLQHGFPHKPTALAWDPSLRLMCIGTASGTIKVFGKPGVEFYGANPSGSAVFKILFVPNQGRLIAVYEDSSVLLWEVNKSSLVSIEVHGFENKIKKISTLCLKSNSKLLLLGTELGNIYFVNMKDLSLLPEYVYQDVVMTNIPQDYKLNPGAVEAILEVPDHPSNILIGYNRGLIVQWNHEDDVAVKTFISNQQLEYLCWKEDGRHFISSHNDGSFMEWDIDQSDKPCGEPQAPYGPYACRAIPKILSGSLRDQPLVAFSGGLPRTNYSDRYTVSVIHGDNHVAFDFTSKVIDYYLIESRAECDDGNNGETETLLVLTEEELVAVDLINEKWQMLSLPYLVSLHASAVTCTQYVSGIPELLWEQLKQAGKIQTNHLYSKRSWPIDGGDLLCSKGEPPRREFLLTGHEDGTVRFWDAGGVTLTPLYKFSTAQFFTGDDLDAQVDPEDLDEEWPPFRKTGIFDPYSDDPRFAVKRVVMCPLSGTMVVAGTAGQVVVAKFDTEVLDEPLKVVSMNIVSDRDNFVWKGHPALSPKQGNVRQACGFQSTSVLLLHPPAAVTSCALQADWGLVSAGTAHGVAVLDYERNKPVTVKCTLTQNDVNSSGDAPITRRKSFKQSLRESFRRLRKGRSQRRNPNKEEQSRTTVSPTTRRSPDDDVPETKPVERQVEARPVDDSMGSFVRCLYFARTFLINTQNTNPTLWAGTNNGIVYSFTITVPAGAKRSTDDVTCQLAKEIQLKHRAPVIGITILDGSNKPLPEPLEVERGVAPLPDTTQAHRVVIASEEQFKIFTLPSLKPFCKYKLTAHEGSRVRRMAFANFSCTVDNVPHNEVDLLCLTNTGDCLVLTVPDLKRQLNAAVVKREDINGISSLVFTKFAEALYLHSSSELQRLSLAANYTTMARCYLPLPAGVRDSQGSDATLTDKHEGSQEGALNGTGSKDSSLVDKSDDVRSNGEETPHNMTVSSSVGDITIDSVRDHLDQNEDGSRQVILELKSTSTTVVNSNTVDNVTTETMTTTQTTQTNEP